VNRSLLRHPVVIGGVVVGLLAVTVLNLRTFTPAGRLAGHGVDRAVGHLVPPSDLSDVVRDAVYGNGEGRGLAQAGNGSSPSLMRDPFSGGTVKPQVVSQAKPRPRAPRASKAAPLVCTAVMLGGQEPLALIAGKAYGPGDKVRGLEVLAINTEGVRLRQADGDETLLAVGPGLADSTSFHVVTRTHEPADAGVTRLATDRPERNQR